MSVNRFIQDSTTGVIRGQYDDEIDPMALNNLVRDVVKKRVSQSIRSVGEEAFNGYKMVTGEKEVTVNDGIGLFNRVVARWIDLPSLETYDRRSTVWLKAIGENKGKRRLALIEQFVRMISDFVPINILYANGNDNLTCSDCSTLLSLNDDHCPNCATQHIKYVSNGVYNDNLETESLPKPMAIKDPYEKFQIKYLRFQGRYDVKLDTEEIEKIRAHIKQKYRIDNLTERFRDANRSIMRETLKTLSMIRYQDDINLLMYIIWNYPPPDLSQYDAEIEKNWREGQAIIEANRREKDPENIDSNDWRLFNELKLVGFDCYEEDFHITSNKDVKKRQDELWQIRLKTRAKKN